MSCQQEKDLYYLKIAKIISLRSKCLSRKIGAVLVKNDSIISGGFNGPARGVKHCNERSNDFYNKLNKNLSIHVVSETGEVEPEITECPRRYFGYESGKGLHLCQAGHAERNALIQAARNGISTKDTTLYCYCGQVCKDCAIEIINAGVTRLVYLKWDKNYDNYSDTILKESGIAINTYDIQDLDK